MGKKRKGNFKYEIGDTVKYQDSKAQVIDRWWDQVSCNRYLLQFVIGRNLVKGFWMTRENNLEYYKKDK